MAKILVSGVVNLETTLPVESFPIPYAPVRYPFFGVQSIVSGVGYNVSKALTCLGDEVHFASFIGNDAVGRVVEEALKSDAIPTRYLVKALRETPQSVVLYDKKGDRAIHTDLKDVQEKEYPLELFDEAVEGCSLAVLGNVNFSRPLLQRAKALGVPVATDLHAVASLEHPYNQDFLNAADILFMSDARLPCAPEVWLAEVQARFPCRVAVVSRGEKGALMAVRGERVVEVPAVTTREIVSTVGAGDALFACFCHVYAKTCDPYEALCKATVFASYKIGERGGAQGFLDEAGLERLAKV